MCFALPLRVNSSSNNQAMMEDGRTVSLSMIGAAKRGQWLLVQSNLAVDTLTQSEARAMRSAIKEVSRELQSRN
jgi:hydrogenase assembly chaperone HypC/HupF